MKVIVIMILCVGVDGYNVHYILSYLVIDDYQPLVNDPTTATQRTLYTHSIYLTESRVLSVDVNA